MNTSPNPVTEIYISVDVEADGVVPGLYSMSTLGAVVAGYRTADGQLVDVDPSSVPDRFYVQLKPISNSFTPEAIRVGLLSGYPEDIDPEDGAAKHQWLVENGVEPAVALSEFNEWVKERQAHYQASGSVFMGYPMGYDWMWVYWYLMTFVGESAFGHGRAVDIKSVFSAKADVAVIRSVKRTIPKKLHSKLPHTHLAVDDAAEQGQLGMNVLRWDGQR